MSVNAIQRDDQGRIRQDVPVLVGGNLVSGHHVRVGDLLVVRSLSDTKFGFLREIGEHHGEMRLRIAVVKLLPDTYTGTDWYRPSDLAPAYVSDRGQPGEYL